MISRRWNSSWWMADSTRSRSIPSAARRSRVPSTIRSTGSAASAATSLSPAVKCVSRFSASYPLPSDSAEPRPESISALRSGEAALPSRICSSSERPSTAPVSRMSLVSQATHAWCRRAGSSVRPNGYGNRALRGAAQRGCGGTSVAGSIAVNRFRTERATTSRCASSGQVPVAEEVGVARVVVPAVELAQLRVGEVRDLAGIAAGVEGVGRVRVERLQDRTRHHLVGRGHGPLHLVVDHPLEHRALAVGRGLELQAVALLLEAQLLQPGEERRVQVDVHQVVEVFPVLGREGVHRPVGGREGVHEGAQAALEHGEKGVPHREALGAAEHDVLEDVRDPAGVPRDGLEQHPEGVLRIRPADVDVVRARGGVSELVEDRVDLGQSLHAQHLVVADPIAGLQAGPVGRTDWFHGPPETVSGRDKRKGSRRDPALPAGGRMELRGAPTAPRTRPGCDA